jgi:hypothetical protein
MSPIVRDPVDLVELVDKPRSHCNTTGRLKARGRHTFGTAAKRLHPLAVRSACALVVAGAGWVAANSVAAAPHSTGALVVTTGTAVKQVASDGMHLVWETGPLEGGNGPGLLLERGLLHGRKRVLLRTANSSYGLALASGWIVYAQGGIKPHLSAIRLGDSHKILLSRSLAAPFAARGRLLAWLEQGSHQQRVVVRDMRTGRTLIAFSTPRCEHTRCYQLEQVTLATDGVVFTRDSTSPDFSWVYRIRFSNRSLTRVAVPHDPQPDLVPASAGAVYYAFGRGWYRWDFGKTARRTAFRANPPAPIIGYEGSQWLLSTRRGCDSGIVSLTEGGRPHLVASPAHLRRLVPARSRLCVLLEAVSWFAARPFTAWALIPRHSSEQHSDQGLYGVVFAGKPLT